MLMIGEPLRPLPPGERLEGIINYGLTYDTKLSWVQRGKPTRNQHNTISISDHLFHSPKRALVILFATKKSFHSNYIAMCFYIG